MPAKFHLEAYVSKQDFPDFGPMGRAHGAGAGAMLRLKKKTSSKFAPGTIDMPRARAGPGPQEKVRLFLVIRYDFKLPLTLIYQTCSAATWC